MSVSDVAIPRAHASLEWSALWTQVVDYAGPILSGALLGCATRVENVSWLIWVSLVPLVVAIRVSTGYLSIGIGSYLGGLAFSLSDLDWLREISRDDGSGAQGVHEWFVFSQLCAVTWPISAVAARWLWVRCRFNPGVGLCLMWIVCDFARVNVSTVILDGTAFPYLHLAQLPGIPLVVAQIGDLGGMYAITACIVGANGIVAGGLMTMISAWRSGPNRYRTGQAVPRSATPALVLVITVFLYGEFRLWQSPGESGPEITAMPRATQWETALESQDRLLIGADSPGGAKLPLFVWPECAYGASLFDDSESHEAEVMPGAPRFVNEQKSGSVRVVHQTNLAQIREWSETLNAVLVVGCVRQALHDRLWRRFNCALILAPGDERPRYYDKIALVPGSEGAPRLGAWLGYGSVPAYERGTRFPTFSVGSSPPTNYRFGVAICYDICFPELFREYFSDRTTQPDFFVVPASEALDATGRLKGLLLRMARLRAIETRRAVVRCVHDGYSCIIDGCGRTVSSADELILSRPFRLGAVPHDDRTSLYSLWGDWLPKVAVGLLVCVVGRRWRKARIVHPQ